MRIVNLLWDEYKRATPDLKIRYLQLIKASMQLFDWFCIIGREDFLFNEECGRTNLKCMIDRCN